jgi:hypothetical protein
MHLDQQQRHHLEGLKMKQPTFFDADPEEAPQGEPAADRSALLLSIDGSESDDRAPVGVGVEERRLHRAGPAKDPASPWDSDWNEVPQPLFASWSVPRQLAYCARRDEHASLEYHQSDDEIVFYVRRAESYRVLLADELKRMQP